MMDPDAFLAEVEAVEARAPSLGSLSAALLVAVAEGLAADTRAFAKRFGLAHALALRAVSDLEDGFVEVLDRDPRTQRTRIALTEKARALLAHAPATAAA